MKTRHFFPIALLTGALLLGVSMPADAQNIKIGVVDMQECLNQFYKTPIELKKVTDLATEKTKELDGRRADYESMTKKAAELDARARDTSLGAEPRQQALGELQQVLQERAAKGQEIAAAEQKIRAEILEARQKMETSLVELVREQVDAATTQQGLDLVFDKSFLPKANKVIVFTSKNVPDVTGSVVAALNKDAPPAAAAPAAPAAPSTGESGN
ncbi:MAG: OmpH family outer membrane protein [Verrucomicrobiae bacterium]|nr:OmpH family outer membrane protein [Verrucomicrobiae bacterium]